MGWIDSDAHVVETPQTWEYLDASEAKFRPTPVHSSADGRLYWFIDGKIRGIFRSVMTAQEFAEVSRRFDRRIDTPNEAAITESIHKMVAEVQRYVPGYVLKNGPVFDGKRVTVWMEVSGLGDYLPKYAGNLDIMTSAAVRVGELIASNLSAR